MKTFKDPKTNEYYQFDDDIIIRDSEGYFFTKNKLKLEKIPNTLKSATLPQITNCKISESTIMCEVQKYLDTEVMKRNYSNINSCISYLNSNNTIFSKDANEALIWRDSVWEYAIQEVNKMKNKVREYPNTTEEFISELSILGW